MDDAALQQNGQGSEQGQLTSTRFEETDSKPNFDALHRPLK